MEKIILSDKYFIEKIPEIAKLYKPDALEKSTFLHCALAQKYLNIDCNMSDRQIQGILSMHLI